MGYLLVAMILVGMWVAKDDHDTIDVGVAILIVIGSFLLALALVVTL
jgi:hypothetical protein